MAVRLQPSNAMTSSEASRASCDFFFAVQTTHRGTLTMHCSKHTRRVPATCTLQPKGVIAALEQRSLMSAVKGQRRGNTTTHPLTYLQSALLPTGFSRGWKPAAILVMLTCARC